MDKTEIYKQYRQAGKELHSKMLEHVEPEKLHQAAVLLGMLGKENEIVLEYKDEANVLFDFMMYDLYGTKWFLGKGMKLTEIEQEIMNARSHTYSSFFKIKEVLPRENALILHDMLAEKEDFYLIDLGFSQTATPGLLMFVRLINIQDFYMTSGFSFVFSPYQEEFYLNRFRRIRRSVKEGSEAERRFIAFQQIYRAYGNPVEYRDVES